MTHSLTFGRASDLEIAATFGIPPAVFGEPEPEPEYWRPCVFCGMTWQWWQRHATGCPFFGRISVDPVAVAALHRVRRTTLPWEAR